MSTYVVAVGRRVPRLGAWIMALDARLVLGSFVVVQWLAVLALALTVRHNGWLYYQGGDEIWNYSLGYALAHGQLSQTLVGYGWSMLLAPIALVAGPNAVSALPAIVLFNVLVLLPVALLSVYGIARRIGGRVFGYWAAALWIALPYMGIRFTLTGYHQKYTELTLPQSLGLTAMPDFPGMVLLLLGLYLCFRALDSRGWTTGVLAGLVLGYSIATKPSNTIALFVPLVLFAAARRWPQIGYVAVGLVLPIATLALWKQRGLGNLPAFAIEPAHRVALGPGDLLKPVHKYIHLSWGQLNNNRLAFREHFYSERVLEWLPIAGFVGLLRKSVPRALAIAAWFLVFLVVKGAYAGSNLDEGTFFRLLMPVFPAFTLLIAGVPLLVPGLRKRLVREAEPEPAAAPTPAGRRRLVAVAVAIAALGVLPLATVAAAATPSPGHVAVVQFGNPKTLYIPTPTTSALHVQAEVGKGVQLTWKPNQPAAANMFYWIYVSKDPNGGLTCLQPAKGASYCNLTMDIAGGTRKPVFDNNPGRGRWTYRIGIGGNWLDDQHYGDTFLLSDPITVRIP